MLGLCGDVIGIDYDSTEVYDEFEKTIKTVARNALDCGSKRIFCVEGENFKDCVIGAKTPVEAQTIFSSKIDNFDFKLSEIKEI